MFSQASTSAAKPSSRPQLRCLPRDIDDLIGGGWSRDPIIRLVRNFYGELKQAHPNANALRILYHQFKRQDYLAPDFLTNYGKRFDR